MKKIKHAIIFLFLIISQYGYTKPIVSDYSTFNVRVNGKGSPVIFINGIGCSSDVWNETVNILSAKNECHVIQIKGFAGIAPATDLDFNKFNKEVILYIKDKQLKNPVLIGHSFGGLMVLRISIQEPSLASKIIILDTYPSPLKAFIPNITQQQMVRQAAQTANQIQSFSSEQFTLFVHNSLITSVTDSLKLSEISNWYQISDRKTLANAYKNYLSTDLSDSLFMIQKPVLILGTCGSLKAVGINEDKVKNIFQMQYKNVKECLIKISAKSHHFIMFDDFNWMISNVKDFLNS